MLDAEDQLESFLSHFLPEVADLGRNSLLKLRELVPPCNELVYDNYNGVVVGFCPNLRPSSAVFSIFWYARGVDLCFLQGHDLPDPERLLLGSGSAARHLKIHDVKIFDDPHVKDLVHVAMAMADEPFPLPGERRLIIQSVSAKQRPRRP